MKIYHIGFLKRGKTLIVQARENVDLLSCEIWQYMGERVTTKKQLYEQRAGILNLVQHNGFTDCKRVVID